MNSAELEHAIGREANALRQRLNQEGLDVISIFEDQDASHQLCLHADGKWFMVCRGCGMRPMELTDDADTLARVLQSFTDIDAFLDRELEEADKGFDAVIRDEERRAPLLQKLLEKLQETLAAIQDTSTSAA